MISNKKRLIETGFEVEWKKAPSSYGQLKNKCAVQKDEMKGLELVIEQLRRDLTDALKRNEELDVVVRDVVAVSKEQLAAVMESVMCDYDPEGVITTATSSYQVGKTKQIILEANKTYLKSVIVKERHELQEFTSFLSVCQIPTQLLNNHLQSFHFILLHCALLFHLPIGRRCFLPFNLKSNFYSSLLIARHLPTFRNNDLFKLQTHSF